MALFEVNCYSNTLNEYVRFSVILPQRGGDETKTKKYPVLYLLHGLTDNETSWMRMTSIERYANRRGIAVVMPTTRRGWYIDSPMGKYYTFIGKELPQLIAEFFSSISAKREDCFVAGLSMGGYGAMKFALSLNEQYAAVATFSAAFDISDPTRLVPMTEEHILSGDPTNTENDVFYLAKRLAESGSEKPKVYIWCGMDDYLIKHNRKMRDLLTGLGYDLEYSETPGTHSWDYWDEQIERAINWLPIK